MAPRDGAPEPHDQGSATTNDSGAEATGNPFRAIPVLVTATAALAVALAPLPALGPAAHRTLVILVVAAGLWMTEALPVAVTALLIPVLAIGLGVTDAKGAFAGFGDPIVFLFFGTFLLTDASARHGLNARLVRSVLSSRWVAGKPTRLLWAVALLGCGISAWVNNTATTAILLPLALTVERFGSRRLLVGTLLACSYAPSLGGIATPVGTAPNLIGLRLLEEAVGSRPSFAQWCAVFAPLAILGTLLTSWWLGFRATRADGSGGTKAAGAVRGAREPGGVPAPAGPERDWIERGGAGGTRTSGSGAERAPKAFVPTEPSPEPHRPWSLAERSLVPLCVIVVLLWITPGILAATPLQGTPWVKAWQTRLPEPAVPLLGALALFMLPSGTGHARILDLGAFRRVDWSTLLLFGGGLTLGSMMFESGLARALGEGIFAAMPIHRMYGIVLAATIMAVLVSEMTSNTASAALVVPVVLALAQVAQVDPIKPALAATVACSFGFMLPVSTPPNALVFGTGRVRIGEMIANGVLLDLAGILMVSVWVTLFA